MRSGAGVHGRTHKINYNTACDYDRMDRFKSQLFHLMEAKKLPRLMALVIREIPGMISCESCGILPENKAIFGKIRFTFCILPNYFSLCVFHYCISPLNDFFYFKGLIMYLDFDRTTAILVGPFLVLNNGNKS